MSEFESWERLQKRKLSRLWEESSSAIIFHAPHTRRKRCNALQVFA